MIFEFFTLKKLTGKINYTEASVYRYINQVGGYE